MTASGFSSRRLRSTTLSASTFMRLLAMLRSFLGSSSGSGSTSL